MKNIARQKVIVILGPTASGKTDLSLKLAKQFHGEIVSADSRQVYCGLNIGSGKVKLMHGQARGIKHYLIDVASPKRTFTVARYKRLAQKAIGEIIKKGKVPFVVGGTGFYIEALAYDLDFPEVKPNMKLRNELARKSSAELYKLLKKLDPVRAKDIDQNNPRRLVRAIEIVKALGKVPHIEKKPRYDVLFLGIKISDRKLRENIDQRLNKRLPGIVREIKKLRKQGLSWQRLVNFGLEYRYVSWYLMGKLSKAEATMQLKTGIWQYARRQYAWFKRLPVNWVNSTHAQSLIRHFLA